MSERRNPAPPTVAYYARNAREYAQTDSYMEAWFALTQAFNHLENAAYAEAEKVDQLSAWKESAMSVLNAWDDVFLVLWGAETSDLGRSKTEVALREAKRLKAAVAILERIANDEIPCDVAYASDHEHLARSYYPAMLKAIREAAKAAVAKGGVA